MSILPMPASWRPNTSKRSLASSRLLRQSTCRAFYQKLQPHLGNDFHSQQVVAPVALQHFLEKHEKYCVICTFANACNIYIYSEQHTVSVTSATADITV